MQANREKHFSWGDLIVGLLMIVAAFFAFMNPIANAQVFIVVFAIAAIVDGVWTILRRSGSAMRILIGIFDILLGIFMLMNMYLAVTALPYVFAMWFIVESALRMFSLGEIKRQAGTGAFIVAMLVDLMGLAAGIILLVQPWLALFTLAFLVGFYVLINGIALVIAAFTTYEEPVYSNEYSAR